jgi:hypothetical protein
VQAGCCRACSKFNRLDRGCGGGVLLSTVSQPLHQAASPKLVALLDLWFRCGTGGGDNGC